MALSHRLWGIGRWVLLAGALLVTYLVFFVISMRVAIQAREVTVPALAGKSVAEATSALASVGLGLQVEAHRPDATVPADHVIDQAPPAGTRLREERSVQVRVSQGQVDPVVPVLMGLSQRSAELELAQDGIVIGSVAEIHTSAYAPGTIVAQDPPPQGRGAKVSLLVNRGEAGTAFVMPDLIGTPGDKAVAFLRSREFRVTIVGQVAYPGVPSGTVVRQTPQAGFQIAPGDAISIEVSR